MQALAVLLDFLCPVAALRRDSPGDDRRRCGDRHHERQPRDRGRGEHEHRDAPAPRPDLEPVAGDHRRDRDRAILEHRDSRGRPLTSHSCRKWFATTLTVAGVPTEVVKGMMRHSSGVHGRYIDPTVEEQAAALVGLPRLWAAGSADRGPDPVHNGCTTAVSGAIQPGDLTNGTGLAEDEGRACNPAQPDPASPPGHGRRDPAGTRTRLRGPGTSRGHTPERPAAAVGHGRQAESPDKMSQRMARSLLDSGVDSTALADMFDALARLLRSGAADVESRRESDQERTA